MKTIIEMAREAGFEITHNMILVEGWEIGPYMQRFAALVRADEREACAKFFDDNDTNMFWGSQAAQHIRARGNT